MPDSRRLHLHTLLAIAATLMLLSLAGCSQKNPVPAHAAAAAPTAALSHYHNVRFDFQVDVPQAHFAAQGESDNGDGQAFASADGKAEVRAYGSWLMEPDVKCSAAAAYRGESPKIAYQRKIGSTSIISGTLENQIFYTKVIRTHDSCLTMTLKYPVSDRKTYDPMVGAIANSFQG